MPQLQKPLRVGVIGTGYFSRYHCNAWQRMPDVELVALLAIDECQGKTLQADYSIEHRYDDLKDLLEQGDIDLIDIVTPPKTHAQLIDQCTATGKAVICQKPFCASVAEAIELVQKLNETKAFVAVHENFRFQPWYREIKAIIESNQLGKIYEINFDLRPGDGQGPNAYLDRQPYFQTQPRFLIQETGIHFIDVFRFLLGEASGVFARLSKLNPVIAGEDSGIVVMEFSNGTRATLNANRLSDHAAENTRLTMGEMHVVASAASLNLTGDGNILLRQKGSKELVEHAYQWEDTDFGGDCVYSTNRHIADHLLYDKPISNLADDYLINRQIEDAIYTSSISGRWIKLA